MTLRRTSFSRRSRAVAVSAVAIAAIALAARSASPVAPQVVRIECDLFHRPAVTRNVRTGPIVRLSKQRATARVKAGAFTFVAKLFAEPGYGEPTSLSLRISRRTTGKAVAAALYQRFFKDDHLGHGFTGLLYAYTPSGAELQYFCRLL